MRVGPVGMEFDGTTATLYVSIDSQLVTLDPSTGATTRLGLTPATSGLEVVGPCAPPPPATVPALGPWALLALTSGRAGSALVPSGRRR